MNPPSRTGIRRLVGLPGRSRAAVHAEVDDEIDALLAARIDDHERRGMSPGEARAEALRRLGMTVEQARDHLHRSADHRERRMRIHEYLESCVQDVRYAIRGLARRPAFTAIAVLTLAIGIGATTAIFSAVNVLLLRRLPYAAPDQLMALSLTTPDNGERKGRSDMVWSYPKFLVLRDAQTVFSDLAPYSLQQFTVTAGDVEQIRGEYVGARYLRTLGLSPSRGRDFDPAIDAHAGAEKQVIITDAYWQRRFNADPAIVGKTIELNRDRYDIIGVAPAEFRGLTGQAEVLVPVTTRAAADLAEPLSHEFYLVARRKPGVTPAAAREAVAALGRRIHEVIDDRRMGGGAWGATARPLDDVRVAPVVRRSLLILFGAVGCLLLIACTNVAGLLLGRASERRRELAVRLAIGAGRARLVRMLLAESAVLALAGGAASIAVAWASVRALSAIDPAAALRVARFGGMGSIAFAQIRLDWPALLFALGTTIVVGVVFGLAPALGATRASLAGAMKNAPAGQGRLTLDGRRALALVEVALAMLLLAGAGLMLRSLGKLLAIDTGFDAHGVLTVRMTVPPGGVARDSAPGFYEQVIARLNAVPGVTAAGIGNCAPLSGGCNGTRLELLDRPKVDFLQMPPVGVSWASPQWFATLRIPLRGGRWFTSADRLGAPKVVVVSETAARRFWPNGEAIGKRVGVGQGGFADGAEVVGVVGDVRQFADSLPNPDVYIPLAQSPRPGMILFVRTAGEPAAIVADVRRALHEVAPTFPAYDVQTMIARAGAAVAQPRFAAVLLGLFAITALSLASLGIYGVMSLAVSARTREIGVRMALGATERGVRRMVVRETLSLAAGGAAIGLSVALVSSRVLRSLLFDLAPTDPATYAAMLAVLGLAAVAAGWIPARRAARVDPAVALRAE